MKKYALYLLMSIVVLGCQKDIGTNEDILQKKKTNKVIYLPVRLDIVMQYNLDTIKVFFDYENDEGDLKRLYVTAGNYDWKFSYSDGRLKDIRYSWDQSQLIGDVFFTYNYLGKVCTGYSTDQLTGFPDPNIPPDENGEYPDSSITWKLIRWGNSLFTWQGDKLVKLKRESSDYTYVYDKNKLKSYNYKDYYDPNTVITSEDNYYFYNDKNYLTKDIKNQNLLMPIGFIPFIGPFENDVTKIETEVITNGNSRHVSVVYNNKYNKDCYPTEINESVYDDGGLRYSRKMFVTYKKIML